MPKKELTPEQQKDQERLMQMVHVRLSKDHTHGGIKLKAGQLIQVERHYADSIVRMKAGQITDEK